jgi:hypothetical protein
MRDARSGETQSCAGLRVRIKRKEHKRAREMKDTFISLSERTFILEALKKENRIDGRRVQDIRTVKIAFREQYGSAEVQYGKTR